MKNEQNTPKSKPLILAMQEAEQDLVATINGILANGVPCYFLELVLDKLHRQIKDGAQQELAQANASQLNTTSPDTKKPDGKDVTNDGS